jgi:hypothetical protein
MMGKSEEELNNPEDNNFGKAISIYCFCGSRQRIPIHGCWEVRR